MSDLKRLRIIVRGGVQGVGFRPFVFRLAKELSLTGWIRNSPAGVTIEVQGAENSLAGLRTALKSQLPPAAFISAIDFYEIPVLDDSSFEIRTSGSGRATAVMMPDMATCQDCVREIFDPADRRFLYPFTNCTNCGPRFSIIRNLPYDRTATSMSAFRMCPECASEYSDPNHRRFHAQPNACPVCGPHVTLLDRSGAFLYRENDAVREAVSLILEGMIVAVKGIGGFHLMARADSDGVVEKLRLRKNRPFKPLALMIPDPALLTAGDEVLSLLLSPAAPIVLVEKLSAEKLKISSLVSPGSSTLGVMVPYTPLHHIMMRSIGVPVIATSGNRASEPICTCIEDALERLDGIADFYLDHNRAILRPVDDSVVTVSLEGITPFRRSRGYSPLPVQLPGITPGVIALGGDQRNTVAVSLQDSVVISQHLGDMTDAGCLKTAAVALNDLMRIYGITPVKKVVDIHPDYSARQLISCPTVEIQHHHAHVLSCMAENQLQPPVFGIVWDGSGYGTDHTVWGGEFISINKTGEWKRKAHFRQFPLPGGERAVEYPGRTAAGMFFEAGIQDFSQIPGLEPSLAVILTSMMEKGINSPRTSSAGRLFDGVAAILGLCERNTYNGQAAIELQSIAVETPGSYSVSFHSGTIDWVPVLHEILIDIKTGMCPGAVSGKFHKWLSGAALCVAKKAGIRTVVLSGGCFQNTLLLDNLAWKLRQAGFDVYSHHIVPPGDGGLSLGQAASALEVQDVSGNTRKSD